MIVCVCKNVSSEKIDQMIVEENLTPKEIAVKLCIGQECKKCVKYFVQEYKLKHRTTT